MKLHLRGIKKGFATNSSSYHNMITFKDTDNVMGSNKEYICLLKDDIIYLYNEDDFLKEYSNIHLYFKITEIYFIEPIFRRNNDKIYSLIEQSNLPKSYKDEIYLTKYSNNSMIDLLDLLMESEYNVEFILNYFKEELSKDYFSTDELIFNSVEELIEDYKIKCEPDEYEETEKTIDNITIYTYSFEGYDG